MQIMCLNAWGGKLHAQVLEYLKSAAPDVLCLQEVVHSPESEKDWLIYRDGAHVLDQRAHFFRDVRRALPDHVAVFCPAAQGVLWDGETAVPSQFGLATFVHKSLPIVGQVQGFVHKAYSPDGYGDHPRARNAHGVRIYDERAGRFVSVTHMHGLRDLRGKMDTPERTAQVARLLEQSRQLAQPQDIVVICGDFNVEPESETLRVLGQAGLVELVSGCGFKSTRNALYPKAMRFADYMLINDETAVREFDVVHDREVSDHCPLILTL